MHLKLIIALFVTIVGCDGQHRLPILGSHNRIPSSFSHPIPIPSGKVRQFLSYPTVSRGPHGGPYPIRGPAFVTPPLDQLQKVATLGLTTGLTGGIALGARAHSLGPVIAAIVTHRTAEVVDVPVPPDVIEPQVLIVEPNLLPVTIEFRSQSSPVNVNQVHIPGPPGEYKETRSEEEPDRVLHEVLKPVIQEVREVIQPFRKITQEILPVQEEVHSVVARGENHKVIKEVEVPAPASVAIAQPVQQVVEAPVEQLVASGTVVRAGLIGGPRVFEASGLSDIALLGSGSSSSHRRALPAVGKPVAVADQPSVNNRPSGRS